MGVAALETGSKCTALCTSEARAAVEMRAAPKEGGASVEVVAAP